MQRTQHETVAAQRDDHFRFSGWDVTVTLGKFAARLLGDVGFAGDEGKAHKVRVSWLLSVGAYDTTRGKAMTASPLLIVLVGIALRSGNRYLRQLRQAADGDRCDRIVRVLGEDFRQHAARVLERGVVTIKPCLHRRYILDGARQ